MRFEESPKEDFKNRIILEGFEVEVVGSAYRERITDLAHRNELDQITECDRIVAEWPDERDELWMDVNIVSNVVEVLETFDKNTPQAIREIPFATSEASYESRSVARRLRLGRAAGELAGLIKGEAGADEWSREAEFLTPEMFASGPTAENT